MMKVKIMKPTDPGLQVTVSENDTATDLMIFVAIDPGVGRWISVRQDGSVTVADVPYITRQTDHWMISPPGKQKVEIGPGRWGNVRGERHWIMPEPEVYTGSHISSGIWDAWKKKS